VNPTSTKPDASHVIVHAGGTTFHGRDAVNLYRATTLMGALRAYARHKLLMTRDLTPTALLTQATEYTAKPYKRGQHAAAADDMRVWVETMKAAMPITHESKS